MRTAEILSLIPHSRSLPLLVSKHHVASLSAIKPVLSELAAHHDAPMREALKTLLNSLNNSLPAPTSGVAFALERRISRENISLAIESEKLACWMRDALLRLPHVEEIVIPHLERFDDLSIKLLARVVPFVPKTWKLFCDRQTNADKMTLLSRFSDAVDVPLITDKITDLYSSRPAYDSCPSMAHLAQELVLTNYSACLRWGSELLNSPSLAPETSAEVQKILALATLNRGMKDEALSRLSSAEHEAPSLTRKAHMACLQSLVVQKRLYDSQLAMKHVKNGFNHLALAVSEGVSADEIGLERAWLLNSAALNDAVDFRRAKNPDSLVRAMSYLKEAFTLAKSLKSAPANYLRFNLAANTVFLLEMLGQPGRALEALEGSFSSTIIDDENEDGRGAEAFMYRRAVLLAKTGETKKAISILNNLVPLYEAKKAWFLSEQVCRAVTAIAAQSGDLEVASTSATTGLEICTRERSKCGQEIHYKNLLKLYQLQGRSADKRLLRDAYPYYQEREAILQWNIPKATPKLPAYIPELDLEEIPKIDLNNYLVGNSDGKARYEG